MTISERINQDIKDAMRARNREALGVLRLLKASLENEKLERGGTLSQEDEITAIAREMRKRQESREDFKKADRQDLVEGVQGEIELIKGYLPEQLSEEEIREKVATIIDEVGATSMKDFGPVMGKAMAELRGQADGDVVSDIAKEIINQ